MKSSQLFLFAFLAVSSNVGYSNGHSPSRFEKYVLNQYFEFEFELRNGFSDKTCLAKNKSKNVSVMLNSMPDKKTLNKVCSISERSGINTKMCSDVVTLYPASLFSS